MNHKLLLRLKRAGKRVETFRFDNGTEVLCLPYGGRVLGLFAAGDERNFLWTNPALGKSTTARNYLALDCWQNTGGERIWLGPEFDCFFRRYSDMPVYHQPRSLNAAVFQVVTTKRGIRLSSTLALRSNQYKVTLKLRLTKTIEETSDPLQGWSVRTRMKGLEFAGYTQRTELVFLKSSATRAPVGLGSLTQFPQGGEMIIPTYGRAKPRLFFGWIPPHDLTVRSAIARCRMRLGSHLKIAFKAHSVTGRAGYCYEAFGSSHLVVRNFPVVPGGDYVDAPGSDVTDAGYCVQACNVSDTELGNFSELEYHVPSIGGVNGKTRSEDISQIWAYRGNSRQIRRIAAKLLGTAA